MGIPNSITKVVNRDKKIVSFDISKTAISIMKAIMDVESTIQWIAECRAKKYADKIKEIVYNEFYNFNFILNEFIKRYVSFEENERVRRLENNFLTERLASLAIENYKEYIAAEKKNLSGYLDELLEDNIDLLLKTSSYSLTKTNISELKKIIEIRVSILEKDGLTDEQYYPTTNMIMDTIERELKNMGEIELAESYMLFREGENKLKNNELSKNQFARDGIPREIGRATLEFNIENDCDTIFALNEWVYGKSGKNIKNLIEICEKRYIEDVTSIAKKILLRKDQIKMIIVAGPSSSNKTTTTAIIKNILSGYGLKLKQINVDDYYKNIEDQPKDEFGDFDFEMPEAIDIELLNKHFSELIEGKIIQKPNFNFKVERRVSYSDFALNNDEILLID